MSKRFEHDAVRRSLLASTGLVAAGTLLPPFVGLAEAKTSDQSGVDQSTRVYANRLNAQVAAIARDFQISEASLRRHPARHDVDVHRLVTTVTVPETGEKLKVSGLLAMPVGVTGPVPVVSWQHGTILSFDQVPSGLLKLRDPAYSLTDHADSLETLLNVHRFAGQGFAVIAADYIGKGPFRQGRGECYVVKDATVQTCMRILDVGMAAMRARKAIPGPLFLNGWSQGAINTQWLHQELRRQGRPVVATAVASPFNELSETWRFWSGHQTFPLPQGVAAYPEMPAWVSLCMIMVLGSYELNYRLEGLMKAAVRTEFHELAAKFWSDYKLDFDPAKAFPSGPQLLVPGFFERHTSDVNAAFLRRLAANTATYHRYDSPIRFYYGLADEALHPAMVGRALAAGGARAEGVPVAGASHRGNFVAALYGDSQNLDGKSNVVDWFNVWRR